MNQPSRWPLIRAKFVCTPIDIRAGDDRPPLLSVSIHKGVVRRDQLTGDQPRADDLSGYKVCESGDIVVNRMRAFQGAIGIALERGIVSPDYIVLRVNELAYGPYLHYLFRSSWFVSEMISRLRGIGSTVQGNVRTPRINADDLGEIRIPVPPHSDQRSIADDLDAETARIDSLIERKQRTIDLLTERLASQIEDVMEASLAAPAPSLSSVVEIAEGQVDPTQLPYSQYVLIAPNHIESGSGRLLELATASSQGAISGKYLCEAGSVIYSKIRPALQKVCIAPTRCLTSADMYPMTPRAGLKPEYLFYFLLSNRFTDFAVMESERVAMPKINRDAFGRIRIPLPPSDDQDRAVSELHAARSWSKSLSDKLHQQVLLLGEHRQAVITAGATGGLNVPGVAA